MNFENFPNQEQKEISEARKELLDLEKTGEYVFHGSPSEEMIEVLEPRQAQDRNEETGEMEDDKRGKVVFSTPYADIAIFHALMSLKGTQGPAFHSFGVDNNQPILQATENLLENAKNSVAKVYVLDKKDFEDSDFEIEENGKSFRKKEAWSKNAVKPVKVIDVRIEDLPDYIEIIKNK